MLLFNSSTLSSITTSKNTKQEMGCHHNLTWKTLSFLFLVIPSMTHDRSMAEGRAHLKHVGFPRRSVFEEDSKMILRAQIGSRPPRCERRCSWCGHCEAIQVPTNPQAQTSKRSSSRMANVAYAKGDGTSNYKPMSWKCKCGKFIFNP